MKKLLLKSTILCLAAALALGCDDPNLGLPGTDEPGTDQGDNPGEETPCDGEGNGNQSNVGDFNLVLKELGADFVELTVTAPEKVEMAYVLAEKAQALSPAVIFFTGTTLEVEPGLVLKITKGLDQNKSYYIYAVAKLNAKEYSEVVTLNFTTKEYEFTELLSVADTYYDGFKVHINVPDETVAKGNVIRYSTTSLTWFNVLKSGAGEEQTLINAVVANGNRHGNYVKNDTTIIRDNSNIVLLDQNGDPVIDEYGQQVDIHDPISPGEPSVFIAGECRWGSDDEMGEITGYYFGVKDSAYIVPLYEWGTGWTGAFQKLEFFAKEPTKCDAIVEIDIPEDEISVTDAIINFTMQDGVRRYFYMILDNSTYNQVIDVYLDGHEDWFQWFLTSYVAFYDWGIGAQTESMTVHAAKSFNDNVLIGGETYHVLCTVMGDDVGATQNFIHKTFKAREKTKKAPIINVEAIDTGDPFLASFRVTAPNKDVVGAYWACNYAREFELMFNSGYTYETLLNGNYKLDAADLKALNDTGFVYRIPTLDGEVSRFAIYGCNDEFTFNHIDEEKEGAGWANYIAPMADPIEAVSSPYYEALEGDWTATATIVVKEEQADGSVVSRNVKYSSKVTISNSAPELPAELTGDIYDLYGPNFSREDVDGMYRELKDLSDRFTEYRLEGQNRMLCTGFLDFDYYTGTRRLEYKSPYDLFTATDYNSLDVPQIMYDFGPKWFLQVQPDGSLIVPFSSMYLPPMHSWPGYPFYVGGYGGGIAFYDATAAVPGFPVEVSSNYDRITIKPIVLSDSTSTVSYYMNALGINGQSAGQVEIVASVISDIVLTKGWKDSKSAAARVAPAPVKAKAATMDGRPVRKLPAVRKYKSMTDFSKVKPLKNYKVDETPNVVTMDMVNETTEKILRKFNIQ